MNGNENEKDMMTNVECARRYIKLSIDDWKKKDYNSSLRLAKRANAILRDIQTQSDAATGAIKELSDAAASADNIHTEIKRVRRSVDSDNKRSSMHVTADANNQDSSSYLADVESTRPKYKKKHTSSSIHKTESANSRIPLLPTLTN